MLSKEDWYFCLIPNTLKFGWGPMLVFAPVRWSGMVDSDLAFVAFVLFVLIAALLFPGGPGTPRRMRVEI